MPIHNDFRNRLYPNIVAIDARCAQIKAFADAAPWVQVDAPPK